MAAPILTRRRGLSCNERDHRLFHMRLNVFSGRFLGSPANFANHDDVGAAIAVHIGHLTTGGGHGEVI